MNCLGIPLRIAETSAFFSLVSLVSLDVYNCCFLII